jgi:hypothetical protein
MLCGRRRKSARRCLLSVSLPFSQPYLRRIGVGFGQLAGRSCCGGRQRASKSVNEQVDKMRLPAVVCLCELWRVGIDRSPPGGGRPNRMENLQIVMNELPSMAGRCRITTLKLHLRSNCLGSDGVRRLTEVLAQCTALRYLGLNRLLYETRRYYCVRP